MDSPKDILTEQSNRMFPKFAFDFEIAGKLS